MSEQPKPRNPIPVYNPDLLSKEELRSVFVARRDILDRIVTRLRKGDLQPTLFVGVRGMGKTTMLRRIALEVDDDPLLFCEWIALTFPEEQYNVSRLSDFYLNILDALSDALERADETDAANALDIFVQNLPNDESARADAAREKLKSESKRLKRKLLLLVDNLNQITGNLSKDDAWAFRQLMETEDWLLLVGATVGYADFTQYDKPFYDFFRTEELRGLSVKEVRAVLEAFAETDGGDLVREWLASPGRLRAITDLTGGNPRTTVLLYNLIKQGPTDGVRADLELLLDMSTPLYKSIFEDLPQQQQLIVHEIALHWHPILAADLAERARLDVTTVSSQLSRLERSGMVQKVKYAKTTKGAYQIGERFFNIWYLMRASRRIRRKLFWLVGFLQMLYSSAELAGLAERHLHEACPEDAGANQRHAEMSLALAELVKENLGLSKALEHDAIDAIFRVPDLRRQIRAIFTPEEDAEILNHAERKATLAEIRAAVDRSWADRPATERDELVRLLSMPFGSVPTAAELDSMGPDEVAGVLARLRNLLLSAEAMFGRLAAGELVTAFAAGEMLDPGDTEGADAAAVRFGLRRLPSLARAFTLAFEQKEGAKGDRALHELGSRLDENATSFARAVWAGEAAQTDGDSTRVASELQRIESDSDASPVSLAFALAACSATGVTNDRIRQRVKDFALALSDGNEYAGALGAALNTSGDYAEAATAFEKAGTEPESPARAADAYAKVQDAERALSNLDRLYGLHPDSGEVALALGERLIDERMIDRAAQVLSDGPPGGSRQERYLLALGDIAILRSDWESAMSLRRQASERAGATSAAHVLLIICAARMGTSEVTADALRRLSEDDQLPPPAKLMSLILSDSLKRQELDMTDVDPRLLLTPRLPARLDFDAVQKSYSMSETSKPLGALDARTVESDPEARLRLMHLMFSAATSGRAHEALRVLEAMDLTDLLLPLAEALRTIIEGDDHLLTLAPEVRGPTEEILAQLRPGEQPAAVDKPVERRRKQ